MINSDKSIFDMIVCVLCTELDRSVRDSCTVEINSYHRERPTLMRLNNGYFRSSPPNRSHRPGSPPVFDFESMGNGSVVIVAPKVLAIEGTRNGRMGVIFVSWALRGQNGQFWTPLRGRNACGHHWLRSPTIIVGVVCYEVVGGLLLWTGHWTPVAMRGHRTERVPSWAVGHLVWG